MDDMGQCFVWYNVMDNISAIDSMRQGFVWYNVIDNLSAIDSMRPCFVWYNVYHLHSSLDCEDGFTGPRCLIACNCFNYTCPNLTGVCDECVPGKHGVDCQEGTRLWLNDIDSIIIWCSVEEKRSYSLLHMLVSPQTSTIVLTITHESNCTFLAPLLAGIVYLLMLFIFHNTAILETVRVGWRIASIY